MVLENSKLCGKVHKGRRMSEEIHDWMQEENEWQAHLADCERRYNIVKQLNPRQFAIVFGMCMKGRKFDELVDEMFKPTVDLKLIDNTLNNLEIWGVPPDAEKENNKEDDLPEAV